MGFESLKLSCVFGNKNFLEVQEVDDDSVKYAKISLIIIQKKIILKLWVYQVKL